MPTPTLIVLSATRQRDAYWSSRGSLYILHKSSKLYPLRRLLLLLTAIPLVSKLLIILCHLLCNLPSLLDITLIMGFTTIRLDGIGPSAI